MGTMAFFFLSHCFKILDRCYFSPNGTVGDLASWLNWAGSAEEVFSQRVSQLLTSCLSKHLNEPLLASLKLAIEHYQSTLFLLFSFPLSLSSFLSSEPPHTAFHLFLHLISFISQHALFPLSIHLLLFLAQCLAYKRTH